MSSLIDSYSVGMEILLAKLYTIGLFHQPGELTVFSFFLKFPVILYIYGS